METDGARTTGEVTRLLRRASGGDGSALEQLMPVVYDDLRARAERSLRNESPAHTLQATALVHETYLRLVDQRETDWADRAHFFAVAATSMRRVLIDHARRRSADKRGGAEAPIPIEDVEALAVDAPRRFLALNEALERLVAVSPRQARVVELRLFSGLPFADIARALEVSLRTVEYDWRYACAWLARELTEEDG